MHDSSVGQHQLIAPTPVQGSMRIQMATCMVAPIIFCKKYSIASIHTLQVIYSKGESEIKPETGVFTADS